MYNYKRRRSSSLKTSSKTVTMAKNASSQKMMEALTSEKTLNEAINEGPYQFYRSQPKTSLPQRHKTHIFEGMDTSFIERDILKVPSSDITSKIIIPQCDADPVRRSSVKPSPRSSCHQNNHPKYKDFVREKAGPDAFSHLPVLSHRSTKVPLSYNTFYSNFVENGRLTTDKEMFSETSGGGSLVENGSLGEPPAPSVVKCSLKPIVPNNTRNHLYWTDTDYIPIDKLVLHIADVKNIMGQEYAKSSNVPRSRMQSRYPRDDFGPVFQSYFPLRNVSRQTTKTKFSSRNFPGLKSGGNICVTSGLGVTVPMGIVGSKVGGGYLHKSELSKIQRADIRN